MADGSPAQVLVDRLVAELGPAAHDALDLAFEQLSTVERAGLWHNWTGFWARPKQLPPAGAWRSWGVMSGRGFGKTRLFAEFVNDEAEAGRAGRIALCAQTAEKTREVMIEGDSGILECAKPWFRPRYEPGLGRITWPNGAQAFEYTAEVPEGFRGPQHHLFWGDELGAWPKETQAAAWSNMRFGLRLGYARLIWSSTPRPVEIIRKLVERAKKRPTKHLIVTGSTLENRANLSPDAVQEWLEEYGGTRLGMQELEGVLLEDEAGAMFRLGWIEAARVTSHPRLVRIVVSVDPAITARRGSDETGIIVAGLGVDGDIYVLEDLSGKHSPERWAKLAVEAFERWGADAIVAEQNRGGNLVAQTLRAAAERRSIRIVEVHAKDGKRVRAHPLAAMYERGRVHHVRGRDLVELETQLTTWDPSRTTSPDRIDALVQAAMELGGINRKGDPSYASMRVPSRLQGNAQRELDDLPPDDDDDLRAASRWD